MTISRVELRLLLALSRALLPRADGQPGAADVDLVGFWNGFFRVAPPLAAVGLRLSAALLAVAPAFLIGRLRLFPGLSADEQDRALAAANTHPLYVVRQSVLALKTFVCLAYFRNPQVRLRFELDRLLERPRAWSRS